MEKTILIAGGTGLIGRKLTKKLSLLGHRVFVLTRHPKETNEYYWNPKTQEINCPVLSEVEILINLSGEGIADKKWTNARKMELQQSRVGTNLFLYSLVEDLPKLQQYICSSGINAYGFKDPNRVYTEEDPFGSDFLSQLVKVWELSADKFQSHCTVTKIRTAVVLDNAGGALTKMMAPTKMGIGSALGSGDQSVPWIHIDDLVDIFIHVMDHKLAGSFNALADACSNKELMRSLAKTLGKPFWFPNVPAFMMRFLYGEMALMLLYGVKASNTKLLSSGFVFQFSDLTRALKDLFSKRK
jgi:uncharacterized protein (TIGR01777 family)